MPGAHGLRVVCRSQHGWAAVHWCGSGHFCVVLRQRWLGLCSLLQPMENPCCPLGWECVALHHCLVGNKKGAAIPLLLLSWLFWEWLCVFQCLSPGKQGRNLSLPLHIHMFLAHACLGWLLFSSFSGMSWIWLGSSVKLGLWTEAGWRKIKKWSLPTGSKTNPAWILGHCLNEIENTYLGLIVANMLLCSWASGVKALLSNGTENWWSVLPVKTELWRLRWGSTSLSSLYLALQEMSQLVLLHWWKSVMWLLGESLLHRWRNQDKGFALSHVSLYQRYR